MIAAGMIGNVLEWYDFAIYGYFAAAIGGHFFPHEDAVAQLLSAFGVFALGYLMRPVGGVVVGHIGDRFGRRAALTFSVAAMAIPTFLIGLLPGYATLGLLAPIALTFLRMVQGLSVGGEYTSSMVFLVEVGASRSCSAWWSESAVTFCAGMYWIPSPRSGANALRSLKPCTTTGRSSSASPGYRYSTRSASMSASSTS